MVYLKRFFNLALVLVFLALPVVVYIQRQDIIDWWRLRNYIPPTEIAQLASDTTMTDYGRKLFYVSNPQIDGVEAFHQHCTDSERTLVLGCYTTEPRIYIYDVTDERLNGVEQVTSAHEMLHAAYHRLSSKEKTRVDDLTLAYYKTMTDERIRKNVEQYRQKDESIVPNELHSILGTEVGSLPAELEQYYSQYFSNRQKVVAFAQQYEAEFNSRNDRIDAYDETLEVLKKQIESLESSLGDQLNNLNSERQQLDSLLAQNRRSEYNQAVPAYNALVSAYNSDARKLRDLISQYNQLVEDRNLLAGEIRDLTKALDSRVSTQEIKQ